MFDLDKQPKLPPYEIKIHDKEYSFDAIIFGYKLRVLEGEDDPERIRVTVQAALPLPKDEKITIYEAVLILADYREFTEKNLEGPLKKVFGRVFSSTATTDSDPAKSTS